MADTVTDIGEARKRRLTPAGRALLGTWELVNDLSPHDGPEPPSQKLLKQILALPHFDRAELAEILAGKVLEVRRRAR